MEQNSTLAGQQLAGRCPQPGAGAQGQESSAPFTAWLWACVQWEEPDWQVARPGRKEARDQPGAWGPAQAGSKDAGPELVTSRSNSQEDCSEPGQEWGETPPDLHLRRWGLEATLTRMRGRGGGQNTVGLARDEETGHV